jgi:hypothetical protein
MQTGLASSSFGPRQDRGGRRPWWLNRRRLQRARAQARGAWDRGGVGNHVGVLTGGRCGRRRAKSEGAAGGAGGRLGADTGGGAAGVDSRRGLAVELQLGLVDLFAATACPRRVPRQRTGRWQRRRRAASGSGCAVAQGLAAG